MRDKEGSPDYFMVASLYSVAFVLMFSALFGVGELVGTKGLIVRAIAGLVSGLIIFAVTYYMKQFKKDKSDSK